MTDAQLIEQYRQGSQEAFAELVRRHVDWVYSAAKRRVGDSHLAEDVTQAAFIALAKKMPRLWAGSTLAPWLLTVVNLSSKAALRADSTRRRHEIRAAKMRSEIEASQDANWDEVTPHLDELVERLGRTDRTAVMLRFYQQKSFAEVGAILGISEEAARKRTSRAVEQLRGMFARRGVNASSMALGAVLLAEAAKPAPAALGLTIASTATSATITSSAMLAKGAIAIMTWTKIKITVAFVVAVLLLAVGGASLTIHFLKPELSVSTSTTLEPSRAQAADDGEYYVGGEVKRAGAYSIGNRQISLWNALVSAGLPDSAPNEWAVTLYRPHAPSKPAVILDNVLLSEFTTEQPPPLPMRNGRPRPPRDPNHMWPEGPNLFLQAGDQIMLVPATKILEQQWAWGPVHEVTLSMNGNEKRCLNFEENKLLDVPDSFLDRMLSSNQYIQWTIDNGADVLAWLNHTSIVPQLVATPNGDYRPWKWDEVTPQLARLELRNIVTPPKLIQSFNFLQHRDFVQPVSLFRTRSGRPGKIQLLEQSNEAGTIRIRYCIADAVPSATKPASQP